MKTYKILLVPVPLMLLLACFKTAPKSKDVSNVNVTSAIINGSNVKLNSIETDSVLAYNAKAFPVIPGKEISLYPSGNPSSPYYQSTSPGTIGGKLYSIFLYGQGTTVESIFREENYPARYADSVIGVRIINLSPNSSPMNVTLQSNTTTNVFSNVAYKQLTDFNIFPLKSTTSTAALSFQVRSSATPASVLATYTLPATANSLYPGISINGQRFKNITIVIKGLQGTTTGTNAFGVFPVVTTY